MITEEEIKKLDNQNLIAQLISTAHTFGNWVMETQAFADELLCRLEPQVGMPSENSFGQWISVKDKFPDEDIPVLVRVKKPLGEVGRYTVNRWTSYTDQNKEWFNKHFSHWVPLPKF